MKRLLSLLLILSLLLPLASCASDPYTCPGNFYYRRTETFFEGTDGVIAGEERELEGIQDDIGAILEAYLEGPASGELESPFPRDTKVLEWEMILGSLHINFNEAFAQLSGIDLTIACSCIAQTFLELTDASTIRIRANGALLNGSAYVIMSADNLNLSDDSVDKLRTDLTLYYTDEDRRYLIGHNVRVNLAAQDDVVSYLVEQLMTAPSGMGLVSPLPSGTKLLSSEIKDGVCTLDFSTEFEQNAFTQSYAQRTTLLSLVNTLTQLESIEKVEFHLEGNLMARYRQLNISTALVFDESAIGPVRTGVNEFDATLYLANGSQLYLASVPTRIRSTAGISQAELVVDALLNYQNENGFYTTIPADTVLNGLTIDNGLCTIDLSEHFIASTDHLLLSVHSLVASVCTLNGVDFAQITINGATPETEYADLFQPLKPSSEWFL